MYVAASAGASKKDRGQMISKVVSVTDWSRGNATLGDDWPRRTTPDHAGAAAGEPTA